MNKPIILLCASLCLLSTAVHADIIRTFGTGTNAFNMTFVHIGNPGNAADTKGDPKPAGSVGYLYNIGKYEVSRDMINKANAAGGLEITLLDMASFGGNGDNRPATGVNWNEAARFVNWLNTSQGYSPAYKFSIQPDDFGYSVLGVIADITLWQATDPGFNAANPFRNSLAKYFLPSVDEWYKAAYYDPNANGGAGGYWDYPTGSDAAPTAVSGGSSAGTTVYNQTINQGPADVMNAGGLSSYGVMGMGGNLIEWEETEFDLLNDSPAAFRGVRGGLWFTDFVSQSASTRGNNFFPTNNVVRHLIGFRVASIPEPSSAALLMLATVGLLQRRKRRF